MAEGTRVKEKALPKLLNLLSPVVHKWALFARQIGVPASQVSQIRAANSPTGCLYTCLSQALDWWVANHHSPTYEAIIAILDPKKGQKTPVMNRTLASQVKKFMAKQQKGIKPITSRPLGGQEPDIDAMDDYTMTNLTTIKGNFGSLRETVCEKLREKLTNVEVKEKVRPYLLSILPRGADDYIPNSSDLLEIFEAMRCNGVCDYKKYFPLESLVMKFGGDDGELASQMKQYKRDRMSFLLATKIKAYIPAALAISDEPADGPSIKRDPKYFKQLSIKLKQRVGEHSLLYLERLWKLLADTLLLPEPVCLLDAILENSILVVWFIPTDVVPRAIQIAQQNTEFFKTLPIESVTIGDEYVYEEIHVQRLQVKEEERVMIQDRFENLYLDVGMRLQQTLTEEEIKDGLQPFTVSLFPEYEEAIPKSSDPKEIFEAINNSELWDYRNYFPLEQITKQFGKNDPEMTRVMEEYKKDLLKVTTVTLDNSPPPSKKSDYGTQVSTDVKSTANLKATRGTNQKQGRHITRSITIQTEPNIPPSIYLVLIPASTGLVTIVVGITLLVIAGIKRNATLLLGSGLVLVVGFLCFSLAPRWRHNRRCRFIRYCLLVVIIFAMVLYWYYQQTVLL